MGSVLYNVEATALRTCYVLVGGEVGAVAGAAARSPRGPGAGVRGGQHDARLRALQGHVRERVGAEQGIKNYCMHSCSSM